MKGNTHALPGSGPLTVVQPFGGDTVVVTGGGAVTSVVVVTGGGAVVPDAVRGHSDVPVVDLTQSITSVEVKHCYEW